MRAAKLVPVAFTLLLGPPAPAQSPDVTGGVIREPVLARLGSDRFRQADQVSALTYSPDGKHLASADEEAIHFWDASDGRRIRSIRVEDHSFFALRYSPDGRTLYAAAVADGVTRLCRIDPTTGKVRSSVAVRT
jgi:WD40 repeat protein